MLARAKECWEQGAEEREAEEKACHLAERVPAADPRVVAAPCRWGSERGRRHGVGGGSVTAWG